MSTAMKRPLKDKTNSLTSLRDLTDDGASPAKRICSNSNRIRVFVRVRPMHEGNDCKRTVDVIDSNMIVFDPIDPIESDENYVYHGVKYKEIGKRAHKNLNFHFDKVFSIKSSNMDVYEATTKQFVAQLLDGFNCTIFAYGATGSGKTHTMLGSEDDPGVIFFTTMELFKAIQNKTSIYSSSPIISPVKSDSANNEEITISVSYFEIYNETVYDLLEPTGKSLNVLHDAKGDITVHGLSIHHPTDAHHLIKMLEYGNANRSKQATDANHQSSRSHAIFQLTLKKQTYSSSTQQMCIQTSKMTLIDLAGSERASVAYKSNRSKSLSIEGGNINKSLLALGNCINALSTACNQKPINSSTKFIPYRSSKLTLILRDSLGGNCQTAMIATINPLHTSYDDTHNTLAYAQRAMGIQLNLKRQSIAIGLQPRNYSQALDAAEREICDLKEKNERLEKEVLTLKEKAITVVKMENANLVKTQTDSVDLLNSKLLTLKDLFNERNQLRKKFLENESRIKKIDLKVMLRRLDTKRTACYQKISGTTSTELNSVSQKSSLVESDEDCKQDQLQALFNQKMHFQDEKENLQKKITENERSIKLIENALRSNVNENDMVIDNFFKYEHVLTQNLDLSAQLKHHEEINCEIIKRVEALEKVTLDSVPLLVYTEKLLAGMNRLSDDLAEKFGQVRNTVEGKKKLIWRDNVPKTIVNTGIIENCNFRDVFKLNIYDVNNCEISKNNLEQQNSALINNCDNETTTENNETSPDTLNNVSMQLLTSVCFTTPPTPLETNKNQTAKSTKLTAAIRPQQKQNLSNEKLSLNNTFTLEPSNYTPRTNNNGNNRRPEWQTSTSRNNNNNNVDLNNGNERNRYFARNNRNRFRNSWRQSNLLSAVSEYASRNALTGTNNLTHLSSNNQQATSSARRFRF